MTALQTAPSSGMPIGYRKKIAADVSPPAKHAAGVVFVAPDGDVLLLRRAGTPGVDNYVGHWALPGGGGDDGEQPEDTARRESREELGADISDDTAPMKPLDYRVSPNGIGFHTFASPVKEKFVPKLNDEHNGYAWSSLNMLPRPLHPAVEATLKDQLGMADDMKPEDWQGMRDGFLKWTAEEEAEPEHLGATDSALVLALDRSSVRTYTNDGHLKVERTHITKANICPYKGSEIPGWQELGLEPERIYQLYRDPEELQKAAPSLNGVPLLRIHKPVNSKDHPKVDTIGSVGTNAQFDGEYLDNALTIWTQEDIDGVDSDEKRELSAGYRYRPDMTPGNFGGKAFDGVMRDIDFNHVAIVEDGRAGPDVVIGDSTENLPMKKSTRLGALVLGMTASHIAPMLAMDASLTLSKDLFSPITSKNFATTKAKLLSGVKLAMDGKLRKGLALDEGGNGLAKLLDALEGTAGVAGDEPVDEAVEKEMDDVAAVKPLAAVEEKKPSGFDAVAEYCRGKGMSEDDISAMSGMFPQPATDEDPDEKKKREEKEAAEKTAKDEAAEKEKMKDMVTKPAMDAAIRSAVDTATKSVRETERGIVTAREAVEPWVGKLPLALALDSAEAVHRHAAKMLNVANADKVHADALLPIIQSLPKPGARPVTPGPIAMDASAVEGFAKRFPEAARINPA